jgi:glycosyltransferase involved in cell wall biosynthesis
MSKIKVVWTTQIGGRTGSTPQAELVARKLRERDIEVSLLHVPPLDIETESPFLEAKTDSPVPMYYATRSVAEATEALNPDIFLIHNFNITTYSDLSRLKSNYPVFMRLGINLLELLTLQEYHEVIPFVVSALSGVDHIIAASRNTANQVGCMVGSEKCSVIPTMVDMEAIERQPMSPDPVITCLARVYPVKNHLTLLQAFSQVKREVPDAELAIVGSGVALPPALDEMAQILGLEADKDYKFTGYMEDLNLLFKETRVFALPSFSENLPQSVLQAYAAGIPCVVSRCGWGSSFKAAKTAYHDDPMSWATTLKVLLTSEPEWNAVRWRQIKELESTYNMETALDLYERLFTEYYTQISYLSKQESDVKDRLKELGVTVRG